jgi:protein-S-isoprenylcysteine O-methyltransferase Ste14
MMTDGAPRPDAPGPGATRPEPVVGGIPDLEAPEPSRRARLLRIGANVVGAAGAAWFAVAGYRYYQQSRSLIGAVFFAVQLWIVIAYLVRRPARRVSQRASDWLLAFGGTFGGVLFRPDGLHTHVGVVAGLGLQVAGLVVCASAFIALGRSFGFAPADRGVRRRGPYAIVRHPIYASYVLLMLGYLSQSLSTRNAVVMVFVCGCNVGRIRAEERFLLATGTEYATYQAAVRWKLVPGIW